MEFFYILGFAFLVALSGAMSPGPLLAYTIYKSIEAGKKSIIVGFLICLGHAILEFILVILLLIGLGPFISNSIVVIIIGIAGGILLLYFGAVPLRDILNNKLDLSFLSINRDGDTNRTELQNETGNTPGNKPEEQITVQKKITVQNNPVIGGLIISMSNPYWWLWWAIIGLTFMTNFDITLSNPGGFWAFFIGHELGDIIWYVPIAFLSGFAKKLMSEKVYKGILIVCSIFMVVFGVYLLYNTIFTDIAAVFS